MSKKVAITGSSGLVGQALVTELETRGYEIIPLVRSPDEKGVHWDPRRGIQDIDALEALAGVIHLAGYGIAESRWTASVKTKIRESRVQGTRSLVESLTKLKEKPRAFLSASAIGYYGDSGDKELTEESPLGQGFLAEVCRDWEGEAKKAPPEVRHVSMRIGIILSKQGGALAKMLLPFRLGLAGMIGDGKQFMSWIALEDIVQAMIFCLENDAAGGAFNFTVPHPVRNAEFTKTLGRVLGRPTLIPLPAFAAKLVLGEMADELLLSSMRVLPKRLQDAGYQFQHPELEDALRAVLEE